LAFRIDDTRATGVDAAQTIDEDGQAIGEAIAQSRGLAGADQAGYAGKERMRAGSTGK
jgi:hypothetical protein